MNTYKFITLAGNAFVFANTTKLKDVIRRSTSSFKPKSSKTDIYRDMYTRNAPYSIIDACVPCGSTEVTLSAMLTFSGPLSAKAEKVAMAKELLQIVIASEANGELDGYPMTMNTVYSIKPAE